MTGLVRVQGFCVVALGLLGCGAGSPPTRAIERVAAPSASASPPARPACVPDTRPASLADPVRTAALEDLAAGRSLLAARKLEKVLDRRPHDVAAYALHEAAVADDASVRRALALALERDKPVPIGPLEPGHPAGTTAASATLKVTNDEASPGDYYAWLTRNGLTDPMGFDERGLLEGQVFAESLFDQGQTGVFPQPDHFVVRYGRALLGVGSQAQGARTLALNEMLDAQFGAVVGAPVDTSAAVLRPMVLPEVRYAAVVGGVLVVELAHEGDGATVRPAGYLVGIDLATNRPIWSSPPDVANAMTFQTRGGFVLAAFGTGPAAKLSAVDAATGQVVATAALPVRPDYLIVHGSRLFAWHPSRATTIELGVDRPSPPPSLGRVSPLAAPPSRALDADARCFVDDAVVALDARDGAAASRAAASLPAGSRTALALSAAAEFLRRHAASGGGSDLGLTAPRALAAPVAGVATGEKVTAACRLVAARDPGPALPTARTKSARGGPSPSPATSSQGFPERYGLAPYYAGFLLADHPVAIYANRFVAVFGGGEVERVLDLEAWAGTPTAPGQLPLAWVSGYEDALLVVTNPRAATARTTSYMARLDPVRERVLWRTEAVLQSRAPLLFEACAVTLAGPPGDVAVVTVRLADGKVGTTLAPGVDGPDFGWDPRGFVYVGLPTARRYFTLQ